MYIILGILFLILSFLEFIFRKFTIKYLLFIVTALLFVIIQTKISWAPDLESYQYHYFNVHKEEVYTQLEPFHIFFIKFCKNLGLNFDGFYTLYGIIILVPFFYFIKKVSPLPIMVLSLFYIIPFFPNITQIRSFLALVIFINAILFYRNNKFFFWFFYLISILCHLSMLAFLPIFILAKFKFYYNVKKSFIVISFLLLLMTLVPKDLIYSKILILNPKYMFYLENDSSYLGTLGLTFPFFLLNNFVIYHYHKNKQYFSNQIKKESYEFLGIIVYFLIYINYLIILQYFIRDFFRITMFMSVLSYCYFSIIIYYDWMKDSSIIKKHFYRIILLAWAFLAYYINFVMINNAHMFYIIEKTINSNTLLN